jgi:hypothetical protein
MRTPDHPNVSEKILKWIENANLFQETLQKTISDLKKDVI